MVDIEAGAIVVSAHLGMPWQNITAGSMNIPSGDCMDKIVLVARKLDERSSLKGCMPPWCELMRAFIPKGLLTRLHDFFKIMWQTGFLNRYRKNLNVRTSTESQNWWSKVCPKRKGNPAMTSWTYSLPIWLVGWSLIYIPVELFVSICTAKFRAETPLHVCNAAEHVQVSQVLSCKCYISIS